MTENYPSAGPDESWPTDPGPGLAVEGEPSGGDDQGKAGAAKEQAAAVSQGAAEAGQHVATVAADQAHNVVAEAGNQAKDLIDQARSELTEQAGAQQKRLAAGLRELGDELEAMTHHSESPGVATDLARQASTRSHDAASWLDAREPGHLLEELQTFARQKPAAFLTLAVGAGLLAGRLGRGVKDAGVTDAGVTDAGVTDAGVTDAGVKDATRDSASSASATPVPEAHESTPVPASSLAQSDVSDAILGSDEERPFASSQDDAFQPAHSSGDRW